MPESTCECPWCRLLTQEQREASLARVRETRERNRIRYFRLPSSGEEVTGAIREYFFAVLRVSKSHCEHGDEQRP